MKLTLTLSLSEAIELIKKSKGVDEVVIEQHSVNVYVEAISAVVKMFPKYDSEDKIRAIKELRSRVPGLGLAEAKVAVENPYMAIDYSLKNNGGYYYPTR